MNMNEILEEAEQKAEDSIAGQTQPQDTEVQQPPEEAAAETDDTAAVETPEETHIASDDPTDVDAVLQRIQDDPEHARDALVNYQRTLGGVHGIQEKERMQQLESRYAQNLAHLEGRMAALDDKPQADPEAQDEFGLTTDNYKQLDGIMSKLPSVKSAQQGARESQGVTRAQVVNQFLDNVQTQYTPEVFHDERRERVYDVISSVANDPNITSYQQIIDHPDVVRVCNAVKTRMDKEVETKKTDTRTSAIEEETKKKKTARNRVSSTTESRSAVPSSPSSLDDIDVKDDKGRITLKSIEKAFEDAEQEMEKAIRSGRL